MKGKKQLNSHNTPTIYRSVHFAKVYNTYYFLLGWCLFHYQVWEVLNCPATSIIAEMETLEYVVAETELESTRRFLWNFFPTREELKPKTVLCVTLQRSPKQTPHVNKRKRVEKNFRVVEEESALTRAHCMWIESTLNLSSNWHGVFSATAP